MVFSIQKWGLMSDNLTSLHIAIVAPPWQTLPPTGYGPVETICAQLADSLIARGHQVVTIGAGASGTTAPHVATYEQPPIGRLGDRLTELLHAVKATRILAELDE